jgi:hypothetical protein
LTSTPPSTPPGPLQRYLRDPSAPLRDLERHLRQWIEHCGLATGIVAVLVLVGLLALRGCWRRRRRVQLTRDARLITVLVPPTVDPAGAEALWANLTGLLRPAWRTRFAGQPHVSFEYVFDHATLTLRLWVPGVVPPGMVEHAVEAAWPGARTTTEPVTSPAPECAAAAIDPDSPRSGDAIEVGGELRLARAEALPIRTTFTADPIRALLGAPAGIDPGDRVIVQVLARPVVGRRVAKARHAATRLHSGGSTRPVGRLLDVLTPGPAGGTVGGRRATTPTVDRSTALDHSAQDRAAVGKQRGALFETRIRYAVTIPVPLGATKAQLAAGRDRARGRAHAIASAFAAFGEHNHYRRHQLRHPDRAVESRRFGRGDLLSIPELAAIAHIPTDAAAPGLQAAGARAVPPPPTVAATGPTVKPLGVADTGRHRPVGLAVADSRYHVHLLGSTGSGKSTLMTQLILNDAHARRGVVVIDPKGDLITDILDRLPADTADRVVLLDADSRERPPCLNPLDPGRSALGLGSGPSTGPEVAVDNLTSIFARVYSAFWGPRTDDILRAACLTLRAQPDASTLADLPRLLSDTTYRDTALTHVTDPALTGFWDWYAHLSDAGRAQAVAPLMNKLRAFLLRPFVRAALAGGPTTLDMPHVLDHGGICLVRIPKGSLGEETTKLIGSLVVASVWQSATARAAVAQDQRPDAALYVDECQNFLNLPYPLEDMLAEARGFRLSMTLAHQHLGQLGRDLKDGISANARSKIFFAASPEDARDLARHTSPRLSEHDLTHLGAYHAAARLVVGGDATGSFTFTTRPLPPAVPGRAQLIRRTAARISHRPANPAPPRADQPALESTDPRLKPTPVPADQVSSTEPSREES